MQLILTGIGYVRDAIKSITRMAEQSLFLISLVVAIIYVLRAKPPFSVYFHAQLIFTFLVWGSLLLGADEYSLFYRCVFVAGTIPIFVGSWWGITEYLAEHPYKNRIWAVGVMLALVMGAVSYNGMTKPLKAYNWIAIWEGCCLVVLGFALSHAITPQRGNRKLIGMLLSVLWLLQALFEFGFTLHMPSPEWDRLNDYLPAMMVIGTFLAIGTLLRFKESANPSRSFDLPKNTPRLHHPR